MHDISQVEAGETRLQGDQRYNALRNLDDQSDASTEVGDWDVEVDEKSQRVTRGIFWRKLSGYRWLLDTSLLLVVIGLLLEKRWGYDHVYEYEFAGDLTGFAPRCRGIQKAAKGPADMFQSRSKL